MIDDSYKQFARRLEMAMDAANLPPKYKGRYEELARRVREQTGVQITVETISKYAQGLMMPRPTKMQALAKALDVDLAWFQSGAGGDAPVAKKGTSAGRPSPNANAAKFLGIALAQLGGARIVESPSIGPVHFQVAVRGAVLSVHAVLAERRGDGWSLTVPKYAVDTFILGILPSSATSFRMVALYYDDVESVGTDAGDAYDLRIDANLRSGKVTWSEMDDFSRLPR